MNLIRKIRWSMTIILVLVSCCAILAHDPIPAVWTMLLALAVKP